jgi:hypothetical protein
MQLNTRARLPRQDWCVTRTLPLAGGDARPTGLFTVYGDRWLTSAVLKSSYRAAHGRHTRLMLKVHGLRFKVQTMGRVGSAHQVFGGPCPPNILFRAQNRLTLNRRKQSINVEQAPPPALLKEQPRAVVQHFRN